MPRFTKQYMEKLLKDNEGFSRETHYSSRNFSESIRYTIRNGIVHMRSSGKTSWADSRFNREDVADLNQTRNFLKKFYQYLKKDDEG